MCVYFQTHTAVPLEHTYLAEGEYTKKLLIIPTDISVISVVCHV